MKQWLLISLALCAVHYAHAFDDVYYYRNIASNDVAKEEIYKEWALKFAYILPKKLREGGQKLLTTGKTFGVQVMKSAEDRFDSPKSKADIDPFVTTFKINRDESVESIESFKNFNEFFYRKFKPKVRIIDGRPNVLVSPADCKLRLLSGTRGDQAKFYIKQEPFNLDSFLGYRVQKGRLVDFGQEKVNQEAKELANTYSQAWALMVFRLAPTDYHRFHFPCDCTVTRIIDLKKGTTYSSVSPIAYRGKTWPISENYRRILKLETECFGPMLMVIVGAAGTNTIELTFGTEEQRAALSALPNASEPGATDNYLRCYKGQACGYFAFGGSTICLLVKKNYVIPPQVLEQRSKLDVKDKHNEKAYETAVRVGQGVAVSVSEHWVDVYEQQLIDYSGYKVDVVAKHLATQHYLDQLDPSKYSGELKRPGKDDKGQPYTDQAYFNVNEKIMIDASLLSLPEGK
ncbi:MAG: phosphatidylserine decarboxylase [Candidatus Babeliales bacterium]